MATAVRAKVLVTYQTPLEKWKRAIDLVMEAGRNDKINYRELLFTDSLMSSLEAGHAPSNTQIDQINVALGKAGIKSLD